MLTHLSIRNFTIIDQIDLDFAAGMTAITGETGAGKSIIIDALALILGQRAEGDLVRPGAVRAELTAAFSVSELLADFLKANDLYEDEPECLLHRTLYADGRSRSTLNGRPVPLSLMKTCGQLLVVIFSQHQYHALLKPAEQRDMLDAVGELTSESAAVHAHYQNWRNLSDRYRLLQDTQNTSPERVNFLTYQLEELEALKLSADEVPMLHQEHETLSHASDLIQTAERTHSLLSGDDAPYAVAAQLTAATRELSSFTHISPAFTESAALLEAAHIQIQEVAHLLAREAERLELDPERLDYLENRLRTIHDLARKHQVSPEELYAHQTTLSDQIEALTSADTELAALSEKIAAAKTSWFDAACALHEKRMTVAASLATSVTEHIRQLGIPGGTFTISVTPIATDVPLSSGGDAISFDVTSNKGHAPQPLSKVASGGELSRICLALYVLISKTYATPTLIFDEVDVGIGGAIAEMVGEHLYALSKNAQVFCITHLPQVAAEASQQLSVQKAIVGEQTCTEIQALSTEARVEEIARMLGGVTITEQTRKMAQEMLGR